MGQQQLANDDDDDAVLRLIGFIAAVFILMTILAVSLMITLKQWQRFQRKRMEIREDNDDDDIILLQQRFDPSTVKQIHEQSYNEMYNEVQSLKDMQIEVRTQLSTLKHIVKKMKEQQHKKPDVVPIKEE